MSEKLFAGMSKEEIASAETNAEVLTRVVMEAVKIAHAMRAATGPVEVDFGPLIYAVGKVEEHAALDVLKQYAELRGSTIQ